MYCSGRGAWNASWRTRARRPGRPACRRPRRSCAVPTNAASCSRRWGGSPRRTPSATTPGSRAHSAAPVPRPCACLASTCSACCARRARWLASGGCSIRPARTPCSPGWKNSRHCCARAARPSSRPAGSACAWRWTRRTDSCTCAWSASNACSARRGRPGAASRRWSMARPPARRRAPSPGTGTSSAACCSACAAPWRSSAWPRSGWPAPGRAGWARCRSPAWC